MTTKLRALRSLFSQIALLVLSFVLPVAATTDLTPANSRKLSPDFTLTDSKGASVRLSDYKGKVVLLDFWATWCHGCKIEIPWYVEFQNNYKEKGLSVVGVSMDEDGWKSVKPFLADNKINYPIVIGNSDLGTQFGLTGLPLTLLIDRNGRIADSHAGLVDKDAFEREIQSLLKDPARR
jgi:peroxiredoxin